MQVTMRQMLEAGVHFGHQTRFWNPKMAPYYLRPSQQDSYRQPGKDRRDVQRRAERSTQNLRKEGHCPVRGDQASSARDHP